MHNNALIGISLVLTVRLRRAGVVVEVALLILVVDVCPLELVHEGGDERVHLDRLPGEDLEDLGDALVVLNHAELDEEARETVLVVLLRRLRVVPRELLQFQSQEDDLES